MKVLLAALLLISSSPSLFAYVYGAGNDGQPVPRRIWKVKAKASLPPKPNRCAKSETASRALIGTGSVQPYQANVHREVTDLQTFGEAPIEFTRLYNSRAGTLSDSRWRFGAKSTWNHDWNWEVFNMTSQTLGVDDIRVRYPDGRDYVFKATSTSGAVRAPASDNPDRWYKWGTGTGGTLVTPEGTEYDFTKYAPPHYRVTEVRNGQGLRWSVSYDAGQKVSQISNAFGRYIYFTYKTANGDTVLSSATTNDGRSVSYSYSVFGGKTVLSSVSYPNNTVAGYTYVYSDSATTGRPVLATSQDPMVQGSSAKVRYTYNYGAGVAVGSVKEEFNQVSNQKIVSMPGGGGSHPQILEGNGLEITRKFTNALFTEERDGLNRAITYNRTAGGFGYVNQVVPPGVAVPNTYTLDYAGRPLTETDSLGRTTSTTYNAAGFETSTTDARNKTTTFTRNTSNQITRVDYPDFSWETWTRNSFGQSLTHRAQNGGTETMTYYAWGEVGGMAQDPKTVTDPLGNVTTYTWHASGLLASVKDARNNTTSYTYNWRGQPLAVTQPDNTVRSHTYDAYGNQISEMDEMGRDIVSTYDEYNRLLTQSDLSNASSRNYTSYEYGGEPNCGACSYLDTVTRIQLPSGKAIERTYDDAHRLAQKTAAPGTADAATITYAYEPVRGYLASVTDPRGKITSHTYDDEGQLLSTTDSNGNRTEWTYDASGNQLTEKRADGRITSKTYDSMSRLTQTVNPLNQTTATTYNPDGTILRLTDAKGNSYPYTYDLNGGTLSMGYPDGSVERFTYDAVGNVATNTTRAGQVMTCSYNNRNLDTLCNWNDTTPDVAKTFDAKGRVVTISNGLSVITKSYHVNGDLATETLDIGLINGTDPAPRIITYGSDSDGNRFQAVYPGGTGLIYRYNQRNQLSAIEEDGPPPLVSYTYDAAGNRITKSLENGTLTNYAYDNGGRLTSIDHIKAGVSFARFDYGYNTVNAAMYVKRDSARGDAYAYDSTDQLTGVQYDALNVDTTPASPVRTGGFAYDAAGNRQTATTNGAVETYSVNSSNRYLQIGAATMGYDANGNLTSGVGGYTYGYDAQSRLKTSSGPGGTSTLTYDGLNRCIARTTNGVTT